MTTTITTHTLTHAHIRGRADPAARAAETESGRSPLRVCLLRSPACVVDAFVLSQKTPREKDKPGADVARKCNCMCAIRPFTAPPPPPPSAPTRSRPTAEPGRDCRLAVAGGWWQVQWRGDGVPRSAVPRAPDAPQVLLPQELLRHSTAIRCEGVTGRLGGGCWYAAWPTGIARSMFCAQPLPSRLFRPPCLRSPRRAELGRADGLGAANAL